MIRTDSGYVRNLNMLLVGIFVIVVLLAIWQIRGILMLAVAGMILTISFSMPVRFFMRWRLGRMFSIVLAMASGVVIIGLLSFLIFPTLFDQFSTLFRSTIPTGLNQLVEMWNSGELYEVVPLLEEAIILFNTTNFELDANFFNQIFNQTSNAINRVGGSVIPLIGGVASALVSIFIVFFVCFFLIVEPDKYIRGLIRLTPLWYRDRMLEIIIRIDRTIRAWLKVTVVSMLLVGTITSVGLALIGVQQWLALGVIAGVISFIPNFSVFIILVPTIAVTVVQAPGSVLIAILIVVVASFIQANIVVPILAAETMHLPPVLVLVGQIVFGFFFGFLGLVLAVPLTAITVILIEEIYIKDVLGDHNSEHTEDEPSEDYELVYAEAD
ncbi:MAG: AI-2E family transporter [Anaerolineae bacterium]